MDGMPALDQYHLPMSGAPRSMDLGLMYKALELGQVSMIAANATDGPLAAHDWTILADDLKVFGSYQACILARAGCACRRAAAQARARRSWRENSQTTLMRKLDAAVDIDHRQVRDVAADFLRKAGLRRSVTGALVAYRRLVVATEF